MKSLRSHLLTILPFVLLISTASCNQTVAPPNATVGQTAITAPTAAEAAAAPTIQPGDSTRKLTVNDLNREYLIHIPPGLDGSRTVPVVFAFHAFGGSSSEMQTMTGFNAIADKDSFLVVYPQGSGTDRTWNGGMCCGSASDKNVDETAFIRQILSDLGTIASIDTKRIYALGHSNGAVLVYRLGCEMSDTFAAIVPVSGHLLVPCQPQQAVSVLHVHGLDDTVAPYAGGGDVVPGGAPPVEQGIATWAQLDGCKGAGQVEQQVSNIAHTVYASCRAGTAVELYTLRGVDHEWPSVQQVLPIPKLAWDFFAAHPKP
jgi:polyhydroxybutyrate depolymerase